MLHPNNTNIDRTIIIKGALITGRLANDHPWKSHRICSRKTIGGRRLVPIELGRSYVDEGWGKKIITLKEFMGLFLDPESSALARIPAQHDLFAQIPSLREDIAIPDYVSLSPAASLFIHLWREASRLGSTR